MFVQLKNRYLNLRYVTQVVVEADKVEVRSQYHPHLTLTGDDARTFLGALDAFSGPVQLESAELLSVDNISREEFEAVKQRLDDVNAAAAELSAQFAQERFVPGPDLDVRPPEPSVDEAAPVETTATETEPPAAEPFGLDEE